MNRLYSIYTLALLSYLYSFFVSSDSINICIKNAVEKQVELNKILTLCRENINKIEIYSNDYSASNIEKKSNYISTSKTDEIIYEMIKKGDLTQAARLATRLESEKTKRIKATAEAEALRSPQIISSMTREINSGENKNENIRSILSLGTNPITTSSAGSKVIQVTTPSTHGAIPGQYVTLSNVTSSIDGIAASEINKFHVISSVPSTTTFTISVLSSATNGSVAGGGAEVLAIFQN